MYDGELHPYEKKKHYILYFFIVWQSCFYVLHLVSQHQHHTKQVSLYSNFIVPHAAHTRFVCIGMS